MNRVKMENHISICICSFKRPDLLRRTLENLRELETGGLFDYSIVVADNDREESGRAAVEEFSRTTVIPVLYCVEPEQNLSLARNKALENATGNLIAYIDDDEFPETDWLLNFFNALALYKADGILGPVRPVFEKEPPGWIIKGRFFEKPRRATGLKLRWQQTSTANVLLLRRILDAEKEPFRREFGGGCEDLDFFKRMMEAGRTFVWCDEAIVNEIVPPERWQRRYLVRRAVLRGQNGCPFADFAGVLKSVIAVPLYSLALPFFSLAGQHLFVLYLMKIGEHSGKLFGLLGFRIMGNKYVVG
jgi:glycosyltransferase involved in cell wall biosynthesis